MCDDQQPGMLMMCKSVTCVMINSGSNYDSLIVRTVAFPVQVAYWIKRS